MTEPVKSGQELLDEFFADVLGIDGVDPDTALVVKRLHEDGKLTSTNIANELRSLREAANGREAEKD